MGKKSGGKKSGGKKKKGGKKKEDVLTWREALLIYKISLMEKQLEDARYEKRALEDKRERHTERNDRLKEEQAHYLRLLLQQSVEFENKFVNIDETSKEQVIEVMKDKWKAAREEEQNVASLKEQIARTAAHIVKETRQVSYWTEYKDKGCNTHATEIKVLEQELVDMQTTYEEMAAHLERTLNKAKKEIEEYTEKKLDQQKYLATEKAIAKLDKYSRQEVQDNDWLKKEVDIHRKAAVDMFTFCEGSELENLGVMSDLFECTVDDLRICRDFFLTQFTDSENLEESGILEVDLAKLSINSGKDNTKAPKQSDRPKSAVMSNIEERMRSLEDAANSTDVIDETFDEGESQFDGVNGPEDGTEDPFNNYFSFEGEDSDNFLQLGPLELKLLNLRGTAMTIYRPDTLNTEELKAKDFKPDVWPVTAPMIKKSMLAGPEQAENVK